VIAGDSGAGWVAAFGVPWLRLTGDADLCLRGMKHDDV
jgi:hypothetical protein